MTNSPGSASIPAFKYTAACGPAVLGPVRVSPIRLMGLCLNGQDPSPTYAPSTSMKATCVLMAVGNQTMLRSLKTLLEPHVEVSAMTDNVLSLVDAVEALEPDLVIVHTPIPDHEHMNMIRHLISRFLELKLIMISGHTDSVVVCDVMNEGVQGYVFQNNAKTELAPAVEEVLRGGTYVSSIEGQEGEHLAHPQD